MNAPRSGRRHLFLALVVAALVALAGCGALGGQDGAEPGNPSGAVDGTEPAERPEAFESVTRDLAPERTASLWRAVSNDGELTANGERLLDALARLDRTERDAVVESVGSTGIDGARLDKLETAVESGTEVREGMLRAGLTDSSGDGLLDGEAALLGLDPAEPRPRVADAAAKLGRDGYGERDVSYLRAVGSLTGGSFADQQARSLALVTNATANGSVTRSDIRAISDSSGDGLLDGMAASLGLDPDRQHRRVAGLADPLAADGYERAELAYLRAIASIADNGTALAQAGYLGLLNETADGGVIDRTDVESLRVTESGTIAGFAGRVGLNNRTDNGTIAALSTKLAAGGYGESDVAFLRRAAALSESAFGIEQARSLGLLSEAVANGTATATERERLADTAGDGLLDSTARALGLDPTVAHPDVAEFAEPLAVGGYNGTEFSYLERIDELSEYRGHDYEVWSQASQLGLLNEAVANGTVTERQLWALRNNASNRLLNGMEVEFGTDPAVADTSDDGYADHLAWGPLRDLGLPVTPGEVDVYVEVDTVAGQPPPDADQRATVRSTFRSEPPDGIGPINVHFRQCADDRESVSGTGDLRERVGEYRDVTGLGFHYMLVNDGSLDFEGQRAAGLTYIARGEPSWMVVDGTIGDRATPEHESSTVAHELGHSLGVLSDDFAGVDSREYTSEEYTSVMNYNHWTPVSFSTGEPFDDYERMAEQSFGSVHQDRSALREMWEKGEVDPDALCS